MNSQFLQPTTASFQKGVARIDGTFSVTEEQVNFEPFNKNVALGPYHLDRTDISRVEKIMGKGGGIIPTTSEAIKITMNDGSSFEFIIAEADDWLAQLNVN